MSEMSSEDEQPGAGAASGCPVGANPPREGVAPYVSYANMDVLHELQFPVTESPLELSFILVSQVKELIFRMIYVELDQARRSVIGDDTRKACGALRRAVRAQRLLLSAWDCVNGMSAADFISFRHILGTASGNQSFMYRSLELVLGNKDASSLEYLRTHGPLHKSIQEEVDLPSLYDEVLRYLHRHVEELPLEVVERNFSCAYEYHSEVEKIWLRVYSKPTEFELEHELAEALMEVSFQFSNWRATHLLVVERMLGTKRGTGGTAGIDWLREINNHRFFPEIWSVRSAI